MEKESYEWDKWTFKDEMLKIPAKCRRLTSKTSRQKVEDLFEKYECLIAPTKGYFEFYQIKAKRLQRICDSLKTGTVRYDGGFFMISEILRIKVTQDNVVVFFKNGTEQSFVQDYEWLQDLF